jgi:hypothetical protein
MPAVPVRRLQGAEAQPAGRYPWLVEPVGRVAREEKEESSIAAAAVHLPVLVGPTAVMAALISSIDQELHSKGALLMRCLFVA